MKLFGRVQEEDAGIRIDESHTESNFISVFGLSGIKVKVKNDKLLQRYPET